MVDHPLTIPEAFTTTKKPNDASKLINCFQVTFQIFMWPFQHFGLSLATKVKLGQDHFSRLQSLVNILNSSPNGMRPNLGRTHGGFKGRKAVIKGTQNGDNTISNCLTLLKGFPHESCFRAQSIHCCYSSSSY
uniref:Uncharacterized protein n=1 Tax=Opuntia streptacantha TaxID=393608 RepID=A0A7C9DF01_OPUST